MDRPQAIYFDRDDTLIFDHSYMGTYSPIQLYPLSIKLLQLISSYLIPIHVISNQSGIGRGYISHSDVNLLNYRLKATLRHLYNVHISSIYYCHHSPEDHCLCRKPSPFLVEISCLENSYSQSKVVFIGDRLTDMITASSASAEGFLFQPRTATPELLLMQYELISTRIRSC